MSIDTDGRIKRAPLPKASSYEELEVWKLSMDVAENSYRLTANFPKEEVFGISSQIRRAASSVPFNVAEGWGRGIGAANIHACRIARGSIYDLRTALHLSKRLHFGDSERIDDLIEDTKRLAQLLQAYIVGMERNLAKEPIATYGDPT